MNVERSAQRYHRLSINLHWLTLLLLIAVYALIELHGYFHKGGALREGMKTWHFMFGLTVFVLVLARVALRLMFRAPPIWPSPPAWMRALAAAMHLALYAFLIGMPLLGWLTLSAKGKLIPFWGLELPSLIGADRMLADKLEDLHATIGRIGYFLIGLHALAALYHHHVMRDDTLLRMLSARARRQPVGGAQP